MKNITVSIPDEIYLVARVWAARHDTSVSAVVRQMLETLDDSHSSPIDLLADEPDEPDLPPLFTVNL
jgi:plasmid stability protein